jgi:hypothetical protein
MTDNIKAKGFITGNFPDIFIYGHNLFFFNVYPPAAFDFEAFEPDMNFSGSPGSSILPSAVYCLLLFC